MSDSTTRTDASVGSRPDPVVHEPGRRPVGAPDGASLGPVVLLLAGDADIEWAADTAFDLAAAWSRDGRRVVVADLHLERPILHTRAGTENLEGVVDVFLYGASISRSARPIPGRRFHLIPAGTYEPDPSAVLRHPRWPKVVAGFRDAGASLVLFAPVGIPDPGPLADWVSDVVLLGDPGDPEVLGDLAALGIEPAAFLVPPPHAEEPAGEQTEEPELAIPPPPPRRRRRTGFPFFLVGVVFAALAVAAVGFYLARTYPELLPWARTGEAVGSDASDAPVEPSAGRAGEALPVSVQVVAFQSFPAAVERSERIAGDVAEVPLFVSPEEVQGVLYYKIMAGVLPDTAAGRRLRERLVADGVIDPEDAAGSWSLLQTSPFAFDLGEFPTPERASARADSLLALEIPTYSIPVPYTDGSRRWQLYGGAYRDSASAEALRRQLVGAGLPTRLVARIGEAPTAAR